MYQTITRSRLHDRVDDLEDARDVIARLCVRRNAAEALDGRVAGVVGRQRQRTGKPRQQRLEMLRPGLDVRGRIVGIRSGVLTSRRRHQLHQAHRALRGPGARLVARLHLDHRPHEARVHALFRGDAIDDLCVRRIGIDGRIEVRLSRIPRPSSADPASAGFLRVSGYGTSSGAIRVISAGSQTTSPPLRSVRTSLSPSVRWAVTDSCGRSRKRRARRARESRRRAGSARGRGVLSARKPNSIRDSRRIRAGLRPARCKADTVRRRYTECNDALAGKERQLVAQPVVRVAARTPSRSRQ